MRVHFAGAVLLLLVACSRPSASESAPPPAATSAPAPSGDALLPEHAGAFSGGPLSHGELYVRRAYRRGTTTVEATLAVPAATTLRYDYWLTMSAGYPPIKLDALPDAGSGFYDCGGEGGDVR